MMIRFNCDYSEGAHPRVLEKLIETNMVQTPGYTDDEYCNEARRLIKEVCHAPEAQVEFLVGGTQANTIIIKSILRPHQGVISADTGHIAVHETGAIEATGHKILTVPGAEGKITAAQIKEVYETHWNDEVHEHVVQPGMVYLSNPTEYGTLYTKDELTDISKVCKDCQLPLFVDGARMGYGLMAPGNDLTLADYAGLCDVFYIGGTKVGAMFGEAVVISPSLQNNGFRYLIKQGGGRLAKGRLLGVQFMALFTDNLYFDISAQAVKMAMMIREACINKGFPMLVNSSTNQQFPILSNEYLEKLSQKYAYSFWEKVDDFHSAVRFCTSWATKEEDVLSLINDLKAL